MTELVLVGFNDDINTRGSNLAEALAEDPDIIFIQEGRVEDYRNLRNADGKKLLPLHLYGIHQDNRNAPKAGSVVIWRHDVLARTGSGFTFMVKALGLMARWMSWVRGHLLPTHTRVFVFSAHRPPQRDRRWWRRFDLRFNPRLLMALAAGRLVIGQMDSNEPGGPPHLPRTLKWVGVPRSIDGFVLSRSIRVLEGPTELPMGSSDHHPIRIHVAISA